MKKVIMARYDLPILSQEGLKFTLSIIERFLYPNEPIAVPMSVSSYRELQKNMVKFSPIMSLDMFVEKFNLKHRRDMVEILAKYQGVCFNSSKYVTAEDYLIRILYLYYGKYTNQAVQYLMDMTKEVGYMAKSEQEIQERVDYLQKGSNFKKKYKDCLPFQLKFSHSDALVSFVAPTYRTPYTYAEMSLLRLSKTYGIDFLPWKDKKEQEFIGKSVVNQGDLFQTKKDLYIDLNTKHSALINILLKSREMQSISFDWSSDMDNLLIDCCATWGSKEITTKEHLFKPLIQCGKTIEECEDRRMALGIRVSRSFVEYENLLNTLHLTPSQRTLMGVGMKRSDYSETMFQEKVAEEVGKPLHLWTEDEKNEYLSRRKLSTVK